MITSCRKNDLFLATVYINPLQSSTCLLYSSIFAGFAGSATFLKKDSNTGFFWWNLRTSFNNIYFVEHLPTTAYGSCEQSIWTCFEIKDVDSTEFFRKMKLASPPPPPHLKKACWKVESMR